MKNIVKVVLLTSVCFASSVSAQNATAPVVTESHKSAAKKLLPILRITENAAEIKKQQVNFHSLGFAQSSCVKIHELESIRKTISNEIKFEDVEPFYINVLTREFTEADLKKMATFYISPTGQKVLMKLPFLEAAVAFEAQTEIARQGDAIQRKVIEAATKYFNVDGSCKIAATGSESVTTPPVAK